MQLQDQLIQSIKYKVTIGGVLDITKKNGRHKDETHKDGRTKENPTYFQKIIPKDSTLATIDTTSGNGGGAK